MGRPEYIEPIVVRRNLDFGFADDTIPKYWMDANPFKTRVMDAVQATFPDGERYFIAAVRAFRARITDPVLAAQVKDFTMQEGQHGQVHTDYNQRLKRQGLRIEVFTRHTKRITDRRLKNFSPEYNLALTAALEHFTAMMADLFFAEKAVLAGADERVRAMLAWHAIEEMEHKAVAFDVMQKVAGVGYGRRALAMVHATVGFSLYMVIAPWNMLGMDGFSRAERLRMYLRNAPWMLHPRHGLYRRLLPMLARYYRPGFHPNQEKTVHNYGAWVAAYGPTGDPMRASQAMYDAAH